MRNFLAYSLSSAALAAALLSAPAQAYKFPGDQPSLGSAVASKVIGQYCTGSLTAPEAAEINAYIARASAEIDARNAATKKDRTYNVPTAGEFTKLFDETYTKKYAAAANCNADSQEEVRDTLEKIRKVMASQAPLYPDESDPNYKPHVGAVISAKVTGEKCPGTLTGLEMAELQYFVARSWLRRARAVADTDSQYEMTLVKNAERDMLAGWRAIDCTPYAIAKAQAIARHVTKDLAGRAP